MNSSDLDRFSNGFRLAEFFILRTPLKPSSLVLTPKGDLPRPFHERVDFQRCRIRTAFALPAVRRALLIASPSLYKGMKYWAENPESKKGKQAERAFVRYLYRMCTRSTPFGLFSGCTIGDISSKAETRLVIGAEADYAVTTRVDYSVITALARSFEDVPGVRPQLRWECNPTLVRLGNRWHYYGFNTSKGSFNGLMELTSDVALELILGTCRRPHSYTDLVFILRAKLAEVSEVDAQQYLNELIDNEVLISELLPTATTYSGLQDLRKTLAPLNGTNEISRSLSRLQQSLLQHDRRAFDDLSEQDVEELISLVTNLEVAVPSDNLLQMDLFKPAKHVTIGLKLQTGLKQAVTYLSCFSLPGRRPELHEFTQAFRERYEYRWVRLLEVIDPELGLGYPVAFRKSREPSHRDPGRTVRDLLRTKLLDGEWRDSGELSFKASELPRPSVRPEDLPNGFTIHAKLALDPSRGRTAEDPQLYIKGVGAPGGARLLSRFAHCSADLLSMLQQQVMYEDELDKNSLHAEVSFMPYGRAGNVIAHPPLREYEIPIYSRASAEIDKQIIPADIWIGFVGEELRLYSARHHQLIHPHITNAHTFNSSYLPPIYRLLGDLQHAHHFYMPYFSWGDFDGAACLPRVTVEGIIISLARWMLTTQTLTELQGGDAEQRFEAVQLLRRNLRLPRFVELLDGDQALTVDLECPISVDSFLHVLRRTSKAIIIEVFPPPNSSPVASEEGSFQHELTIPCVKVRSSHEIDDAHESLRSLTKKSLEAARRHTLQAATPAGDWIYVKLYAGVGAVEALLTEVLPQLLMSLRTKGLCKESFFVKYSDPEYHLRLRLRPARADDRPMLLDTLFSLATMLVAEGRVRIFSIEPYFQEIDRYGGVQAFPFCERLFTIDSSIVLDTLAQVPLLPASFGRNDLLYINIDRWLRAFGLSLDAKLRLTQRLRSAYSWKSQELGSATRSRPRMHSSVKRNLHFLLDGDMPTITELASFIKQTDTVLLTAGESIRNLEALEAAGQLSTTLDDVLCSLLHMHVNRSLKEPSRSAELEVYNSLAYLYRSFHEQVRHQERNKCAD